MDKNIKFVEKEMKGWLQESIASYNVTERTLSSVVRSFTIIRIIASYIDTNIS